MNYVDIMAKFFPLEGVNCTDDFSVYENLSFVGTPRTKEELDALLLTALKSEKNKEIDIKTRQLIENGFVFDSILFSASETAQRNWMAIDQFKDDLTYPFAVSTKEDGEYSLPDAATAHTFVLSALGTLEYHYASGRALKQLVNSATTEAEINAVEDNR